MATHKPTRSPRRAQLHSNSGLPRKRRRLVKSVERLPVYEILYALNRDFEQVLADFARVQELGAFRQRDLANTFRILVQEMRAWANMELIEALKPLERKDWTHFSRLHNATLTEAKLYLAKKRKAAGKKGQRKRPGAASEDV